MKSLVLAEKPSVARDIARLLKRNKNIPGAIEGSQYIVTWALGHLVTPVSYTHLAFYFLKKQKLSYHI